MSRISTEWPTAPLGEICSIVSGATPRRNTPEFWDGDIAWATPRDLSKLDGPVLTDTAERITEAGYGGCSTTLLPVGATLFSSRAPIGHVALAGIPVCTNQGFKSLVPGPRLDSGYLYFCMKHYAGAVAALGTGSTFAEVSKRVMERFEIPVPPISEQERIAARLRQADATRAKQRLALARLDDFLAAVFDEMFGDPVTNPKNWPVERVGDL